MTSAHNIHQGAGLGRPMARLLDTRSTRGGAYVRSAPTVVERFSTSVDGYDHQGPLRSSPDGTFDQSRKIAWRGGNATGFRIRSMVGEVDVIEVQSGGKVIPDENRPAFAFVLPPGTRVGFRLKEALEYQQLSLQLQPDFVLDAAGLGSSVSFDIVETRDYRDPLSWQLARVIYGGCIGHAPQGILYTETAATLLAIHLVRNLSTVTRLKEISRGGLPPSILRRACDYMMSRLGEDVSLHQVAASVQLSTAHFSTAFKQSLGIAPHAWLRRQRIERAKTLFHDPSLDLTQIAMILGYANQSSFGVAFKRATGLTPMEWQVWEAV
jgi:AraC family transcriptional regulator